MLPIAGQTAGPNGVNFFVDTNPGGRGVFQADKNSNFFSSNFKPSQKHNLTFPWFLADFPNQNLRQIGLQGFT